MILFFILAGKFIGATENEWKIICSEDKGKSWFYNRLDKIYPRWYIKQLIQKINIIAAIDGLKSRW